tara:strand:- start:484 stop:777 length:294 start_codon:yes stop_codon:yes gene_type:complete
MNDEQIQKVIDQYVRNRQYQKDYYRNRYHEDEEFRNKAKDNSRNYYKNNISTRKELYQTNKDFIKSKRKYRYWKSKDDIEGFKTKYPEEWEMYFKDQ